MSDVRFVTAIVPAYLENFEVVRDDPNGTHLLVHEIWVERIFLEGGDGGWGIVFDEIVDCLTCGGSGEVLLPFLHPDAPGTADCPDCNGRGWVLNGGDDE